VRGTSRYKVRRGDTLISIVRKLHCSSVQEIAEMNGLKHHHISIGQTLKLPVCR
jgi:membrane-bound lytic murein transglycosylase D